MWQLHLLSRLSVFPVSCLCGCACVSIKGNDCFSILLVHIIAGNAHTFRVHPRGQGIRWMSATPCRTNWSSSLRSCDIWAFHSHSPNSISKGWLVWLEQHKWRIKESRWIAAQLKLENAFMSSSDFRATIRRWNRSCGSTWIFSPSNLTDDFVARVTAWLLRLKANSVTNVPVIDAKMAYPISLASSTFTVSFAWTPFMMFLRPFWAVNLFCSAKAFSSVLVSFMSRFFLDSEMSLVSSPVL